MIVLREIFLAIQLIGGGGEGGRGRGGEGRREGERGGGGGERGRGREQEGKEGGEGGGEGGREREGAGRKRGRIRRGELRAKLFHSLQLRAFLYIPHRTKGPNFLQEREKAQLDKNNTTVYVCVW